MTNQKFLLNAALSCLAVVLLPQLCNKHILQADQGEGFRFPIDPKTPVKDLLPVPPKISPQLGPLLADDLAKVPEMQIQKPLRLANGQGPQQLLEQTRQQMAKINFLNQKKADRFVELLLENRADLAGLPFQMGDACRLDKDRSEPFRRAVSQIRDGSQDLVSMVNLVWKKPGHNKKQNQEYVAALMQMMPPEASPFALALINHLADFQESEATRALVRVALHGEREETRRAALKALEKRRDPATKEYLLKGMGYPWPEVARNSAAALVYLKAADVVPDLIKVLDRPDPRAPLSKEFKGNKVTVVREVVRINHHRSCLLCHPPGNTKDVKQDDILVGAVPNPGEPLSPSFYMPNAPDIVVRADITYLRQDFSRMQKVPDAAPWPPMQRFDFLVRTRILNEVEARISQAEFARQEPNSPYRQAAVFALRGLTGRDAEPTAAAWRKALSLPGK